MRSSTVLVMVVAKLKGGAGHVDCGAGRTGVPVPKVTPAGVFFLGGRPSGVTFAPKRPNYPAWDANAHIGSAGASFAIYIRI